MDANLETEPQSETEMHGDGLRGRDAVGDGDAVRAVVRDGDAFRDAVGDGDVYSTKEMA